MIQLSENWQRFDKISIVLSVTFVSTRYSDAAVFASSEILLRFFIIYWQPSKAQRIELWENGFKYCIPSTVTLVLEISSSFRKGAFVSSAKPLFLGDL